MVLATPLVPSFWGITPRGTPDDTKGATVATRLETPAWPCTVEGAMMRAVGWEWRWEREVAGVVSRAKEGKTDWGTTDDDDEGMQDRPDFLLLEEEARRWTREVAGMMKEVG